MSLRKCATRGCLHQVRSGDSSPTFKLDANGKAVERKGKDGWQCWRCRAGRTGHLQPTRES